jgi:hypothetical protein
VSDEPVWDEKPWENSGGMTVAEVRMGDFIVRVYGHKGRGDWWWEIFHEKLTVRSLRKAQGGGNMTEQGAKNVALGVLGVAIYADGVS